MSRKRALPSGRLRCCSMDKELLREQGNKCWCRGWPEVRQRAKKRESTSASKFGNAPSAWDKPLPITSFFINK